ILAHGPPLPLAQIGAPFLPGDVLFTSFFKTSLFGVHRAPLLSSANSRTTAIVFSQRTNGSPSSAIQSPEYSLSLNQYLFKAAVVNYRELLPDFPGEWLRIHADSSILPELPSGKHHSSVWYAESG